LVGAVARKSILLERQFSNEVRRQSVLARFL
jgi:hypothetical protein